MVEKTIQHTNDFFYSYGLFEKTVIKLAKLIKKQNRKYINIFAIPRGGLILGVYLSHRLNLPMIKDGINKHTLIVDDICDTGQTLKSFTNLTKVSLIAKPKGLKFNNDLIYDIKINDNVWVHFPWEKSFNKNEK